DELLRDAAELLHVRVALLALVGAVLQVRRVAGRADDLVDELRQLAFGHVFAQTREEASKCGERSALACRRLSDLLATEQRFGGRDPHRLRELEQAGPRLVA